MWPIDQTDKMVVAVPDIEEDRESVAINMNQFVTYKIQTPSCCQKIDFDTSEQKSTIDVSFHPSYDDYISFKMKDVKNNNWDADKDVLTC